MRHPHLALKHNVLRSKCAKRVSKSAYRIVCTYPARPVHSSQRVRQAFHRALAERENFPFKTLVLYHIWYQRAARGHRRRTTDSLALLREKRGTEREERERNRAAESLLLRFCTSEEVDERFFFFPRPVSKVELGIPSPRFHEMNIIRAGEGQWRALVCSLR